MLRFFRRIKILPGLKLNVSKRGMSVSAGVRGAHVTVGTQGKTVSAGLPGTGLSWRQWWPKTKPTEGESTP